MRLVLLLLLLLKLWLNWLNPSTNAHMMCFCFNNGSYNSNRSQIGNVSELIEWSCWDSDIVNVTNLECYFFVLGNVQIFFTGRRYVKIMKASSILFNHKIYLSHITFVVLFQNPFFNKKKIIRFFLPPQHAHKPEYYIKIY